MQADMRPHTCRTSPYKLGTHISAHCKQFLAIMHNKYYLCDDIYAPINCNLGQLQCPIGALLRILAAHDYVILALKGRLGSDRHFGSNAADVPAKHQSNRVIVCIKYRDSKTLRDPRQYEDAHRPLKSPPYLQDFHGEIGGHGGRPVNTCPNRVQCGTGCDGGHYRAPVPMAWNIYTNKNSNLKCIRVKHVLIQCLFKQTTYQQKNELING